MITHRQLGVEYLYYRFPFRSVIVDLIIEYAILIRYDGILIRYEQTSSYDIQWAQKSLIERIKRGTMYSIVSVNR